MQYKDYYQTLAVERDAAADEIKRAYRKLARKYHPDVNKETDAEDKFKDVSEAYEVLRDPEKRAAYDQIGPGSVSAQEGFRARPDGGFDFRGGDYTGADAGEFSDFFRSVFGEGVDGYRYSSTGGEPSGGMRGRDHVARVELDLEDTFTGGQRVVTLHAPVVGADGRVINRERSLKVNIPKGVRAGQQLRLARQGMPGIGTGEAGDLYLQIAFKPHRIFRVDGSDLILELPVAPWEAALGATVKTPTPAGPVDLRIPAGSNSGRRLRLKRRGMPGKNPGDLYAVLRVMLPPANDDAARKLYEQMAERMNFNPRASLGV